MQIMDWDISVQVSSERPFVDGAEDSRPTEDNNERIDKGRME